MFSVKTCELYLGYACRMALSSQRFKFFSSLSSFFLSSSPLLSSSPPAFLSSSSFLLSSLPSTPPFLLPPHLSSSPPFVSLYFLFPFSISSPSPPSFPFPSHLPLSVFLPLTFLFFLSVRWFPRLHRLHLRSSCQRTRPPSDGEALRGRVRRVRRGLGRSGFVASSFEPLSWSRWRRVSAALVWFGGGLAKLLYVDAFSRVYCLRFCLFFHSECFATLMRYGVCVCLLACAIGSYK